MKAACPSASLACVSAISATRTRPPPKSGELYAAVAATSPKNVVAKVRRLLAAGANVDEKSPCELEETAVHAVTRRRLTEVAEMLLLGGADVNIRDSDGRAPLHLAVNSGSAAMVGLLLRYGARTSVGFSFLVTPLHTAAEQGRTAIVALLLRAGANSSATTFVGHTPLYSAVTNGHLETAALLLAHDPAAAAQAEIAELVRTRLPLADLAAAVTRAANASAAARRLDMCIAWLMARS